MYSCVLGMEDETALSIIDPVTLNVEIKENILEVRGFNKTIQKKDLSLTSRCSCNED